MAFEPQRIAVELVWISFKDIWTLQQEVTVDGPHVKDGSYTTTIEIPLEKPKKKISVHLKKNAGFSDPPFRRGYLYIGNDGLVYVAKDENLLESINVIHDIGEYFSPSYVLPQGISQAESSLNHIPNE